MSARKRCVMELPKRKKNRLSNYEYSTPNAYFITVCTNNRKNLFWQNVGALTERQDSVPLTTIGMAVRKSIEDIPTHYPMISVDNYVIMPNHIHLLLQIHEDCSRRSMSAPTISTVVRMMKWAASKAAGFSLWQKGFYDHVVRSEKDHLDIWNYIAGNPGRWTEDRLCKDLRL